MRVKWLIFLFTIVILVLIGGIVSGQEDTTCELDATEIVTVIESVCSNTGNNELCYGNNDVEVATRNNAPEIDFSDPGDIMSVSYVQSLYLSALNEVEDLWGVAQMRLVTTTARGPREVTLLLYGDVEVDNAVEPSTEITVATTASINIRSIPRLNGAVLASAPRGSELVAVGRLEDSSWVRVLVPQTEAVGWLSAAFIQTVDESLSLDMLDVMEASDTYFGPMQAFYINTGTNLSCDNVATDGLIIQTPEGTARVTILINEVSIELISPLNGSATAFVTANAVDGMTINVIDGAAIVSSVDNSFFVDSGFSTTIPLNVDLTPASSLNQPTLIDDTILLDIPVLNYGNLNPTLIIDAGGTDVSNGTGTDGDIDNDMPDTDDGSPGNANGNANGNSNGNSANGNANGNSNGNSANGNANGNSNND